MLVNGGQEQNVRSDLPIFSYLFHWNFLKNVKNTLQIGPKNLV